jgi:prevent-host-death family protein
MERVVSATEARVHFGELLRQATETGQAVIVTRDGKARVVALPVEEYERLRADQASRRRQPWEDLLERAHRRVRAELGDRRLPPSEEMIREMREERDAQHDLNLRDLR